MIDSIIMMIIIMCGAEGYCRIVLRQSGGILVRGACEHFILYHEGNVVC